jgi:hypothetical protein
VVWERPDFAAQLSSFRGTSSPYGSRGFLNAYEFERAGRGHELFPAAPYSRLRIPRRI